LWVDRQDEFRRSGVLLLLLASTLHSLPTACIGDWCWQCSRRFSDTRNSTDNVSSGLVLAGVLLLQLCLVNLLGWGCNRSGLGRKGRILVGEKLLLHLGDAHI